MPKRRIDSPADGFDAFGSATEPVSPSASPQAVVEAPADPGADAGANPGPRSRQRASGRLPAPPEGGAAPRRGARSSAELSPEARNQWRHRLRAQAGQMASARQRMDVTARMWAELVAEARNAGVPERLIRAAGDDAEVDLPGAG